MEGRNERIYIRVSSDELEAIREKAAARHLSVSAYIRMVYECLMIENQKS